MRGTPFLYAGEELGLQDAVVPPDRVVDPGGRDGCRAPIPWTTEEGHGWGPDPWLPWPPEAADRVPDRLRDDPESILHLYRRLLAERKRSPALSVGDQTVLDTPDGVMGWDRSSDEERRRIIVNFTSDPVDLGDLAVGWLPVILSDQTDISSGSPQILGADQAVVLRPA